MASYKLFIDRQVRKKDMPRLSKPDASRVAKRIGSLATNPRPCGAAKLVGHPGYRLRQGNYRILYLIDDSRRVVTVQSVGIRKDVYR